VLEEMAFFGPIFSVLGALDRQANERIALAGAAAYAGFGFTTAQEGRASRAASETSRAERPRNRDVMAADATRPFVAKPRRSS
jgi:hypothetical protein